MTSRTRSTGTRVSAAGGLPARHAAPPEQLLSRIGLMGQCLVPAFLALTLAATAGVATAASPGRDLAATCTGCHGTDGRALPGAGISALAGANEQELLQRLREFKYGDRPATIMHQIAKGYSDEQLDLIAAYFAARK